VSRKTTFMGLNSDEVLLSMLIHPAYWQSVPMIKFSHPEIARLLNINGNYVAYRNLFDPENPNKYVLSDPVGEAYRKKPGYRNKFDNELIRLDERARNTRFKQVGGSHRQIREVITPRRDEELF
jgi:hypothetical protein